MTAKNIYQKIWDSHLVKQIDHSLALLYVDLHLVHEVTSPQAFSGLVEKNRPVRQPQKTLATMDHSTPTKDRNFIRDEIARKQVEALQTNCKQHNIALFDLQSINQGIVHVIGPEQGRTQPGMVIVCGDSHTATHGAFGALAFGIGTSEVEHVLATQVLAQYRSKTMKIDFQGSLQPGCFAKDMILALIGKIGTAGGTGYVFEYSGSAIRNLSMEGRMTICNMSIEGGARAGLIEPDEVTFAYLKDKPGAPKGADWQKAIDYWRSLASDPQATYDNVLSIDVDRLEPQVTWGTNPGQVTAITSKVPKPADFSASSDQVACQRSLDYMGLKGGEALQDLTVDRVFIGSCTNARIEDLRIVAKVVAGKKVHSNVHAMIVPGSGNVRAAAEKEGLDRIFIEAGFDWRQAGCSMCLGMNEDILQPQERCASTSNRNFEGRQGKGGRTHLVSPAVAAATAIHGKITDVRQNL